MVGADLTKNKIHGREFMGVCEFGGCALFLSSLRSLLNSNERAMRCRMVEARVMGVLPLIV